ncbi:hypothetical protein GCM10027425_25660 [Alteromonas gracilis]
MRAMRTLTWRGLDDPDRIDLARVAIDGTTMQAHGTSSTPAYALSWSLVIDAGWVTRRLDVAVRAVGWSRSLRLERSDVGVWSAEAVAGGVVDLPAPGLADPALLEGAVDCDLGLCPVTNTMPLRRLGLLDGAADPTTLLMAWVEVPSLRVLPSEQVYAADGSGRVSFASGSFAAALEVDDVGLVIDYPELARRTSWRGVAGATGSDDVPDLTRGVADDDRVGDHSP